MHAANPKDPLLKSSSEYQRILFEKFGQAANGFQAEDAIGAAFNVIINALRQTYDSQQKVEERFDELAGKMKSVLLSHYENGRRKQGTFPFNQVVNAQLHVDKDKFLKQ